MTDGDLQLAGTCIAMGILIAVAAMQAFDLIGLRRRSRDAKKEG